jgi:hypothetical protein
LWRGRQVLVHSRKTGPDMFRPFIDSRPSAADSALLNLEQWPTVGEDAPRDPTKQHFIYRLPSN